MTDHLNDLDVNGFGLLRPIYGAVRSRLVKKSNEIFLKDESLGIIRCVDVNQGHTWISLNLSFLS